MNNYSALFLYFNANVLNKWFLLSQSFIYFTKILSHSSVVFMFCGVVNANK